MLADGLSKWLLPPEDRTFNLGDDIRGLGNILYDLFIREECKLIGGMHNLGGGRRIFTSGLLRLTLSRFEDVAQRNKQRRVMPPTTPTPKLSKIIDLVKRCWDAEQMLNTEDIRYSLAILYVFNKLPCWPIATMWVECFGMVRLKGNELTHIVILMITFTLPPECYRC